MIAPANGLGHHVIFAIAEGSGPEEAVVYQVPEFVRLSPSGSSAFGSVALDPPVALDRGV